MAMRTHGLGMAIRFVNLHSGEIWEQTMERDGEQEYTRMKDGIVISGPQPQYFRRIQSALDDVPKFND